MDSSLNRLKTWIPATIQSFKLPPQGGYLSKIAVVAGLGNIIITVYILFIGMHFQQKYMLSFFPI